MNGSPCTTTGTQVTIGDTVTFVHQARTWTGTVVRKHRPSARVVCDHQRGFRVPYGLLTVSPGTIPQPTGTEALQNRVSLRRAYQPRL